MQQSSAKMRILVLVSLSITLSLVLFNAAWADSTDVTSVDGINAPAAVPTLPPLYTYLNSTSDATVGGVSAKDEDIVRYNSGTDTWILVGLTGSDEDIDAIAFDPAGRLVISTHGSVNAPGVTAKREDLIVWNGSTWEVYLDGSAIQLTKGDENVMGAWIDPTGHKNIYLSTKGKFAAASGGYVTTGDSDDIFGVSPGGAPLPITAGALLAHFDGDTVGFNKKIDDFFISFTGVPETATGSASAAAVDETSITQYDVADDETSLEEDTSDEESVGEDSMEEGAATRLFLPAVFK